MAGAAQQTPSPGLCPSPPKVAMPSAGGRTFGGNGATDMAGAAQQTPSPGSSAPSNEHNNGQPAPLVGADEARAPQARRLVRRGGKNAKSLHRLSRRTFRVTYRGGGTRTPN